MDPLQQNVRCIDGIGETRAKALEKLGIHTLQELLSYFPRRYEDRSIHRSIQELQPGESACVEATIASPPSSARISKGRELLKVRAVDDSGCLDLIFFNRPYLKNTFHTGERYIFFGQAEGNFLRKQMINPIVETPGQQQCTGSITPIYPLTAGLNQTILTRAVQQGLKACSPILPEILPESIRRQHQLCYIDYAYENIHFPHSWEALDIARRRLVFQELFFLSAGLQCLRSQRTAIRISPCRSVNMEEFYQQLPFSLTKAQCSAIDDTLADMCSGHPMNRLCQGDVGSGKTMVAAACIFFAAKNGLQSALMAPTEILAQQHYQNLAPLLESFGICCALLTGATSGKKRSSILQQLQNGEITFCIGTHALLTDDVIYQNLGLVVTDEQHRFGVGQRSALSEKAKHPHVLVMSATPIPRTLALIMYGDLSVSLLNELPPGRQKVDTFAVNSNYRPRLYAFIQKLVKDGRQVYIVCPLVEENDELPDERKAVTEYAKKLQEQVFPQLQVGVLHGKMKNKEKDHIMEAFSRGEIQILVSTTVIEVGVDVPNAALMIVENAERFGLSQLHQLRGRVGRGQYKSYCVLVSDSHSPETKARLKIMTESNDGFRIAEEDLRLRGPGDFFGSRQHGLPGLKMADLNCDIQILQEAQKAARSLLEQDPTLSLPEHQAMRLHIERLFSSYENTMN